MQIQRKGNWDFDPCTPCNFAFSHLSSKLDFRLFDADISSRAASWRGLFPTDVTMLSDVTLNPLNVFNFSHPWCFRLAILSFNHVLAEASSGNFTRTRMTMYSSAHSSGANTKDREEYFLRRNSNNAILLRFCYVVHVHTSFVRQSILVDSFKLKG